MAIAAVRHPHDAAVGLTEDEAAGRLADREATDGVRRDGRERTSRPVVAIVRANVFTRFNAILGALLAVILVVGPLQDALFGVVLVANAAIGIVQELRAKRSLDRLALLVAPHARVIRSGRSRPVPANEVVVGDVILVSSGDQLVADGEVVEAHHLEVDESLLSGEAEPVEKRRGDAVLSGSFVAAGSAAVVATHVGADAFARKLAAEARAFTLVRSELRAGIDRILRLVTWLLVPTSVLLVASQVVTHESLPAALRGSVAGVGSMVPEGLVLLTSVAFAAGALRLSQQQVLVQELAAVEVLARVDVVCLDKTGTLTEPELEVTAVHVLREHEGRADVERALATLAGVEPEPNATMRAVALVADATVDPFALRASSPFSSARKWSAVETVGDGTWVLGAPEIVAGPGAAAASALARAESEAMLGRRVLLLARTPSALDGGLPGAREPIAAIVLEETIRPDAAPTLAYFAREGIAVKIISGDHPETVAAVARRCGLETGAPVDARTLADDPLALEGALEAGIAFGRVTPHQKRDMVEALQRRGHVVAMTGDGVNDVLALKAADLGVAMASGSAAARSVAPIVLLTSSFAALPAVVAEGRRVIANVERVASLFLTKTVYAFLLAVAVGVARLPFPFLPRHLTVVSSLTIGIPAFFLALSPNASRARPGFVRRALRFALPAGTVAAVATFAAYALVRSEPGTTLIESRTAATFTLFGVGVWVLTILARPWTWSRRALVTTMVATFLLLASIPPVRSFFELDLPRPLVTFAAVGVVATGNVALELGWQLVHEVEGLLVRRRTPSRGRRGGWRGRSWR